jgi:hypothetical protein
MYKQRQQEEV